MQILQLFCAKKLPFMHPILRKNLHFCKLFSRERAFFTRTRRAKIFAFLQKLRAREKVLFFHEQRGPLLKEQFFSFKKRKLCQDQDSID